MADIPCVIYAHFTTCTKPIRSIRMFRQCDGWTSDLADAAIYPMAEAFDVIATLGKGLTDPTIQPVTLD